MWSNSDPISVPLSVTVVPTVRVILSVLYTIPVQYNLVPTVKQSDSVCPLHQTSAIQLASHRQRVISHLPYDSSNSISSRVHVVQC